MQFGSFAVISRKHILSYLLGLGALFLLLATVYYFSEKSIIRSSAERDLKTLAELTESQLSSWYADQMGDAQMVSSNNVLLELVTDLRDSGVKGADTALYQFLRQIGSEHDFHIVTLFSPGGNLLMTAILNGASADLSNCRLLNESVLSGRTLCSDFYYSQADQRNYIDFVSPVFDESGKAIAVLCMKVDSDLFLEPILSKWPIVDEKTDNYLILNPLRNDAIRYQPANHSASGLRTWTPVSERDQLSSLAASGISGHLYGTDYNGNRSLAYVVPVSSTPWILVVKMDLRVLFSQLRSRMVYALVVALLLFVLCFFVLLFAYKYRQANDLKRLIDSERELSRYQEQFKLTMEALVEGVATIDGSGKIAYLNRSAARLTGWTARDALGKMWNDVFRIDLSESCANREDFRPLSQLPANQEKLMQAFLLPRKGDPLWVLLSVISVRLDNSGRYGSLISIIDISRQMVAEQEVRERDLRFKQLVSEMHDAVWTGSADGSHIFDVNDEFERICGISAEALKASPRLWDRLVHPDDRHLLISSIRVLKVSGKSDTEYRIVKPDRTTAWVRDRRSLIFNDKGKAIYLGGIITDISVSKKYEADLIAAKEKAEANERLKTAFLSNMSHEIRTPLNCILGFTQILGGGGLTEQEVLEYSGYIDQSGNRLLAMLSNIMELSRIESGVEPLSISEFRVNELLEQICRQFSLTAQKKKLTLMLDIPVDTDQITMHTDIVRLDRILSNLVGNALKYTREGSVTMGYKTDFRQIEFYVADTGIGISKEQSEHIFERFYQTEASISGEYEGVGLGLALCKELASSLGGVLHFISERGKGTTFFLSLPCSVSQHQK